MTAQIAEPIIARGAPVYMTIKEAAEALAMKPWPVAELVRSGELQAVRFGKLVLVSAYDVEHLTAGALAQVTPWWATAPNPSCVAWCEETHDADEFTHGAAMLCRKTIADTDDFTVEVQAYVGTDEHATPDVYAYAPAEVWVDFKRGPGTPLTPAHARSLTGALMLATSEAATVAERTVRS